MTPLGMELESDILFARRVDAELIAQLMQIADDKGVRFTVQRVKGTGKFITREFAEAFAARLLEENNAQ